jgi:hypothetical protein
VKESNPKDAFGAKKLPFSVMPQQVMAEVCLGMLEGSIKYGRHNYRVVGVRASVYFDAAMRHLTDWWEGQDIDPDSGLHHIIKAMASLAVLRDAMHQEICEDDRPPRMRNGNWMKDFNKEVERLLSEKDIVPPHTHQDSK